MRSCLCIVKKYRGIERASRYAYAHPNVQIVNGAQSLVSSVADRPKQKLSCSQQASISSTDQGGAKRRAGMAWFFDAAAECSQWSHHSRANFSDREDDANAHFGLPWYRLCGDLAFGASTDGGHYGRNGCSRTGRCTIAVATKRKCRGRSIKPFRLTPPILFRLALHRRMYCDVWVQTWVQLVD